jgi:hypothetical protein
MQQLPISIYQSIYAQEVSNRYYLRKNVQLAVSKYFYIQCLALAIFYVLRLLLAKFLSVKQAAEAQSVGLSWSALHTKRLQDLSDLPELTHTIDYKTRTSDGICSFKKVYFWQILRLTRATHFDKKSIIIDSPQYFHESFWYRLAFWIDYAMLDGLLNQGIKVVYIAGYNDRYSLMISHICSQKSIPLHVLQHGLLGKFSAYCSKYILLLLSVFNQFYPAQYRQYKHTKHGFFAQKAK